MVTVDGRVAGDPSPLPAPWPGAPARLRVVVAVDALAVGDGPAVRAAAPVVVLAPAGAPPAGQGDRVRVTGRAVPTAAGEDAAALVLAGGPVLSSAGPAALDRWSQRLRDGVRRQAGGVGGDAGALLPGVAVGSTAGVPDDLRAALRTSGLTHLTAVSGAHFSTVAGLVLALAGAARVPARARAAVALVAGAALLLVVHPVPSVVRAAAMGAVGVLGMLVGRPSRAPAALAAAVVVLLVADPWRARDLGTALSVTATAAVVLLAPALVRRWEGRLGRAAATALAVPVAAQLACGPLVVVVGGGAGLWAVPANLLAAPAVVPATVLGLLTALLDPVAPGVAAVCAHVAGAACWWVAAVARTLAGLPGADVPWVPGTAGAVLLAAAGAGLAGLLLRRR
ncbi:competence protein ComEC [Cellulomonas marina]|uniref:Competence protein ComEC n=1 Tax=Cellulomonas marina TaxID=988821 RepID=A0A1I0YSC8_9CELL|nr:competence protein ComEC [Cellulomonas marina]